MSTQVPRLIRGPPSRVVVVVRCPIGRWQMRLGSLEGSFLILCFLYLKSQACRSLQGLVRVLGLRWGALGIFGWFSIYVHTWEITVTSLGVSKRVRNMFIVLLSLRWGRGVHFCWIGKWGWSFNKSFNVWDCCIAWFNFYWTLLTPCLLSE